MFLYNTVLLLFMKNFDPPPLPMLKEINGVYHQRNVMD